MAGKKPWSGEDASDEDQEAWRERGAEFDAERAELDGRIREARRFVTGFTEWSPAPDAPASISFNRLIPLRVSRGDAIEIRVDEMDPFYDDLMGRHVVELRAERLERGITFAAARVRSLDVQFRRVPD